MKKKYVTFSVQLTKLDNDKFKQLSKNEDRTQASMFRLLIHNATKQQPNAISLSGVRHEEK